jgi:hypothetical protein
MSEYANALRSIEERLAKDLFGQHLMQNDLRGVWIEYAVAEAIGSNCKNVGYDWHAWDLQIGEPGDQFPQRIRIQVKNTSRTQTWNKPTKKLSECQWDLILRNKPNYFDAYNPGVPCEPYGFLCDAFVLCCHFEEDWCKADHRNLSQWDFYVVPVTNDLSPYPIVIPEKLPAKNKTYVVKPATLRAGIRRRAPVEPVKFHDLSETYLRQRLGLTAR